MVSKTTPVLIGTLEKEIGSTKILNWDVNKIGGELIWNYEGNSIKSEDIRCKMCRKKLALVSQIYCPLGPSSPDRVLFICCCINPRCWNKSSSWAVVRCQRKDKPANQTTGTLSSTQWLADEDAWGEAIDEGATATSNPVDTELSNAIENIALRKATTSESSENQSVEEDEVMNEANPNVIPEAFDCPTNTPEFLRNMVKESTALGVDETPIFKPYYIEVCEEPEGSIDEEEDHAKELLSEYERTIGNPFNEQGKSGGGVKMEQESYEKDAPRHGDRSFFKFYKRISRLPSQIIRYCWNGEPLYISDPASEELKKIGKCQYCGASKVFELQLLPALVDGLKLNNNESYGHPVEFGTAVVFTCEESCWNQGDVFRLESILVQPDPDEKYFQTN